MWQEIISSDKKWYFVAGNNFFRWDLMYCCIRYSPLGENKSVLAENDFLWHEELKLIKPC